LITQFPVNALPCVLNSRTGLFEHVQEKRTNESSLEPGPALKQIIEEAAEQQVYDSIKLLYSSCKLQGLFCTPTRMLLCLLRHDMCSRIFSLVCNRRMQSILLLCLLRHDMCSRMFSLVCNRRMQPILLHPFLANVTATK